MTLREALSLTDALVRLQGWKRRTAAEIGVQRRRADLWRHRAMVQSERAYVAEREARQLRERNRRLEDHLLSRSVARLTAGEPRGVAQPTAGGDVAAQSAGLENRRTEKADPAPPAGLAVARRVDGSPAASRGMS